MDLSLASLKDGMTEWDEVSSDSTLTSFSTDFVVDLRSCRYLSTGATAVVLCYNRSDFHATKIVIKGKTVRVSRRIGHRPMFAILI